MSKRIIVCGSRKFNNKELLFSALDTILSEFDDVEIVSGHAAGADLFAEEYAIAKNLKLAVFHADWNQYGKAAGPIRNRDMLEYARQGDPLVIAFWDGQSRGTRNMITLAKGAGVGVRIIDISREMNDEA